MRTAHLGGAAPAVTRPDRTRRGPALTLALLAGPLLAGCAGPLSLEVQVVRDMDRLSYRLDDAGRLAVLQDAEAVDGAQPRILWEAALSAPAMDHFRHVLAGSGLLIESDPSDPASPAAPLLMIEASLGLWQNRLLVRGQDVASVRAVLNELNRHLPDRYRIAPPAGDGTLPQQARDLWDR